MALLYRSYECIQLGLALEIAEKPRRAFPRGEAPQADAVPGPTAGHLSLVDHRRVALFAQPSRKGLRADGQRGSGARRVALFAQPSRKAVRIDPPLGGRELKRKAARRRRRPWLGLHHTLRRGPLVLRHLRPAGWLPLHRCKRLHFDIRRCGFRMTYALCWIGERCGFGRWLWELLR